MTQEKKTWPKGPSPAEIDKRFNLLDAAKATPEGKALYIAFELVSGQATTDFMNDTAEAREVWDQVCRTAGRKRDRAIMAAEKAYLEGIGNIADELSQDPRFSVWAESPEEKARREAESAARRKSKKPPQTEPE